MLSPSVCEIQGAILKASTFGYASCSATAISSRRGIEISGQRRRLELVVHRFTIARVFHGIGEGDPLGANPPSGRRFDRLEVDDSAAVGPSGHRALPEAAPERTWTSRRHRAGDPGRPCRHQAQQDVASGTAKGPVGAEVLRSGGRVPLEVRALLVGAGHHVQ